MALRLCRIHWENGFQTGNCSDLSAFGQLKDLPGIWGGEECFCIEICNITADTSVVFVKYGRYIEMLETPVQAEFFS